MSAIAALYKSESRPPRKRREPRPEQPDRPKMTAADARTFDRGIRPQSYGQILRLIGERAATGEHTACTCEPYRDVFTFKRWKAQAMSVRKGEHAMKLATWIEIGGDDDDDEPGRLVSRMVPVFCRCQVSPEAER